MEMYKISKNELPALSLLKVVCPTDRQTWTEINNIYHAASRVVSKSNNMF